GGADTALWRVEHGSTTYALRVFRPEQAQTCLCEMAAMETARQAQLPVPTIHASGFWHNRPALLLSWCRGVSLWEAIRRRPWRVWSLGRAFGRTQAQIHQVSAFALSRQLASDWMAWAGPDEPALQDALRCTAGRVTMLLHLDYHPLNVLTDGKQITAI